MAIENVCKVKNIVFEKNSNKTETLIVIWRKEKTEYYSSECITCNKMGDLCCIFNRYSLYTMTYIFCLNTYY